MRDLYKQYLERNELGTEDIDQDISNGVIGLMFSEVGEDNEYEIQVSYDINAEEDEVKLTNGEETYIFRQKQPLADFKEELRSISWEDYYSWAHQIVEEKFSLDIEF